MELFPSIASSNCLEYGDEVCRLNRWNNIHIDIEDGIFTPNITFGMKTFKAISSISEAECIQVHLMATNPCQYLEEIKEYGTTEVFAHIEALSDVERYINKCCELGLKPGLALKTRTPVTTVLPYVDDLYGLLFMTSEPKGKREEFYLPAYEKIFEDIQYLNLEKTKVVVDGGLTTEKVIELAKGGISGVVLGRIVFSSFDYYSMLTKLDLQIQKEIANG